MSHLLITLSLLTGSLLTGCGDDGDEGEGAPPAADTASEDSGRSDGDSGRSDGDSHSVAVAEDCSPGDDAPHAIIPVVEDFIASTCGRRIGEGTDRYDDDGDGYSENEGDCDDAEAAVNPGAEEIPYDGVDNDCNGGDLTDVDGDGDEGEDAGGDDCDDTLSAVHPGAEEWANGVDDNCDGAIDEDIDNSDDDGDGYSEAEGDCDDAEAAINPGAEEIPYDGVDNDCDFYDLRDVDGDGYDSELVGGSDCDDDDPGINPEADDTPYDGIDQDCDGADLTDVDGDGWTPDDGDCDDTEPDANPGMDEAPDYIDNDCDGTLDEGTERYDDDGDGYSEVAGDCNDEDSEQGPRAVEINDGIDNNCNDLTDERNLDDAVAIFNEGISSIGYTIDAGDFNGDGVQDIVIGDDSYAVGTGQAWVVSGDTAGGLVDDVALFSVVGSSSSSVGTTVQFIPDMDGDGDDELLVSAPSDYLTSYARGEGLTYLIAGGADGLQTPVATVASDILRGGSRDAYSPSDLAAGDWSGDGISDFALGDYGYEHLSTDQGATFIFDGSTGPGALGIIDVPDTADATILGTAVRDHFGNRLEGLPDLDGDGYGELLIMATDEYNAYLFDGDEVFAGSGDIRASSATAIFTDSIDKSGWASGMTAGDFDGDGDTDIAIGNYSNDSTVAFFDNDGGFSGTIDKSVADAVVSGYSDGLGTSLTSADVDGDGMDELIASAYAFSEIKYRAGAVFVFDADDLAVLDGSNHVDVGRPIVAEDADVYWGYSTVAADGWWAAGTRGSSGSPYDATVHIIPFDY